MICLLMNPRDSFGLSIAMIVLSYIGTAGQSGLSSRAAFPITWISFRTHSELEAFPFLSVNNSEQQHQMRYRLPPNAEEAKHAL